MLPTSCGDGDDDAEDILSDALTILGVERNEDPGYVQYGPLRLTVAPKANTLLADQLFSPALVLAELIERGIIQVAGRRIIELGAGSGLPSLLAATTVQPPSLIVVTDYPDEVILGNLRANVERNNPHYRLPCQVYCVGYEWGTDAIPLLDLSQHADHALRGYDVVIMSDLLHFNASHEELVGEGAGVCCCRKVHCAPRVRQFLEVGKCCRLGMGGSKE
ncbi:hypothetical protein JVU11DRAFT_10569 [Chiua virens]|nr:hypothetical protein JVU11DRAFT_10569 [Chiua virens]